MALVLAEQLLLVALDDEKGRDQTAYSSDPGLAAALLLDLGRVELLRLDDASKLTAVAGAPPEHPVLREAYDAVRASSTSRDAKGWVDKLPGALKPLRDRLARGLVERGVLTEEHGKFLGLFPQTRFPQADPAPERELRARLVDVLVTGRAPTQEEALLVGLLEPLGLVDTVVPKESRKPARERAKQIGERGLAGTAVSESVRQMQVAISSAAVVAATSAAVSAATSSSS